MPSHNQDAEQLRIFLNQLRIEEHIPAALNELKNLLAFKPVDEDTDTIINAGITKIVQCLNVTDNNQVNLACEVLKICFDKFQPGDVVKNYTGYMMYFLRHEKSCVRQLAVDQVYKAVSSDLALLPVPQYIDVFVAVAQLVGDSDIAIANKAILITSNLPFEAYPKVLDQMKIILEYSVSSKCNAYEVIINISTKSYELFQLSANLGYIDHLVVALQTNDILYQLNLLELLSRLAIKPHGINYLVKQGALKRISDLILEVPINPHGDLLTPGYMKFLGSIGRYYPREIFEKYPVMIDFMFETFEICDPKLIPVTLDTLGFIGCTVEGKLCLAALGSRFTQAVECLGRLIKNCPTEIKVFALYCFASLISVHKDPNVSKGGLIDHRVTLMTREWFRSFNERPPSMQFLFGVCKNPFPDIKLGGIALLNAVCQHQWGEEMLATTAGFIEYLLDRTVDHTMELKEAKYNIIKSISSSVAFDANIILRLQTYVEQGPFYCETEVEVAVEGD